MAWPAFEKPDRSYDVAIVGAGISGINMAYRLQQQLPHLSFVILEGREDMGGTWSFFKYPGLRSDSDLYTFGFAWRPWRERTSIARADLIQNYVRESAQLNGIDKKILFKHKVSAANFSTETNAWTLDVDADGTPTTFKARFLQLCTGYYDYTTPLQTVIPGIETFQGKVVHPQFWPEDLDYSGKDVVVIGSGATAVTILPAMAETAGHITMLQRSPGYIVAARQEDVFERNIRRWFSWWPSLQHSLIRMKYIALNLFFSTVLARYPEKAKAGMLKRTSALLPEGVPADPHFTPKYFPGQQRICLSPNGDFFDALKSGKASVETGTIDTVTKDSIKLESGKELRPDIIITATGLKLIFASGMQISVDSKVMDVPSKFIWKGLMLEDLPNLAFSFGYTSSSWTLGADASAQLICRLIKTMQREGNVRVTPRVSEAEKKTLGRPKGGMTSTYLRAGAAAMPRAGDSGQWRPRSHFVMDILNAWYGDIRTSLEWV